MLKDKVILITGSSRGIGRILAKEFAMLGCQVIINYHTNKKAALETVKEIKEYSTKYLPNPMIIKADVSNENDVIRMITEIITKYGRIDILVNNAGIYKNAISWKMKREDWDKVLAVNLTGPFLCIKHVLPIMRRNRWGRIINISSVLGQIGAVGGCNYATSKSGLFGLTKSIAKEVARFNITVNCIVLGYFKCGMGLEMPKKIIDWVIENTPLKRLGNPKEIAELAVFLCNGADYITGQIIHINGGLYV